MVNHYGCAGIFIAAHSNMCCYSHHAKKFLNTLNREAYILHTLYPYKTSLEWLKINKPVNYNMRDRRSTHRAQTTEGITNMWVDILGVSHIGSIVHVIHCHFYLTTLLLRLHANMEKNQMRMIKATASDITAWKLDWHTKKWHLHKVQIYWFNFTCTAAENTSTSINRN